MSPIHKETIAVLGGTGREGKGLAYRFAQAGYKVLIGSRDSEKALITETELLNLLHGQAQIEGMKNIQAAAQADVVFLAVPYSAHQGILKEITDAVSGKLLVDVTVPLIPPEITKVLVPPSGSAAQEAREILGDNVDITTAFQTISFKNLMSDHSIECDVLITGTRIEARTRTLALVKAIHFVGWDAGPIENSVVVEGLAPVLRYINKNYGVKNAGIKITGIPKE